MICCIWPKGVFTSMWSRVAGIHSFAGVTGGYRCMRKSLGSLYQGHVMYILYNPVSISLPLYLSLSLF